MSLVSDLFSDCQSTDGSGLSQLLSTSSNGTTLYTWTESQGLTASTLIQAQEQNIDLVLHSQFVINLNLTQLPPFVVRELLINSTGRILLLIGDTGVLIVCLPKDLWTRRDVEQMQNDYLCRSELVDPNLLSKNPSISIRKVRFNPGSRSDKHIGVLYSDNVLRLYDCSDPGHTVHMISFNNFLDFGSTTQSQNGHYGLADSAVSFDFGPPCNICGEDEEETDPLYPALVLCSTGEVYGVHTDVAHYRSFEPFGPLTMHPASEDNYGVDACDVVCLSSAPVPVVVIANTNGVLYHCVLIVEEHNTLELEPDMSLFVYESMQLELQLSTVDLSTGKQSFDKQASSPLLLIKDPQLNTRFFVCHSSGIHGVELGWTHDLSQLSDKTEAPVGSAADVDYLVCVKPQMDGVKASMRGLALLSLTNEHSATALVALLPDWSVYAMEIGLSSIPGLSDDETDGTEEQLTKQHEYLIDQIKRILHRTSNAPVLKSKSKDTSEKETGELVLRSIQIYRTEYMAKIKEAKRFLEQRTSLLQKQKSSQIAELNRCSERLRATRADVASVRRQQQKVMEHQQTLNLRLKKINENLCKRSGPLSKAEYKLNSDLDELRRKSNSLSLNIEKLDQMAKSCETERAGSQVSKTRASVASSQQNEKVLEDLQSQLEKLVTGVQELQVKLEVK